MPVQIPPKPAIIAPAPIPVLKEIKVISGGKAYHVTVNGIPCSRDVVFVSRAVQVPSQRMTVAISCDGARGDPGNPR